MLGWWFELVVAEKGRKVYEFPYLALILDKVESIVKKKKQFVCMFSSPHRLQINILTAAFILYVMRKEQRQHNLSTVGEILQRKNECGAQPLPRSEVNWPFLRSSAMKYVFEHLSPPLGSTAA